MSVTPKLLTVEELEKITARSAKDMANPVCPAWSSDCWIDRVKLLEHVAALTSAIREITEYIKDPYPLNKQVGLAMLVEAAEKKILNGTAKPAAPPAGKGV